MSHNILLYGATGYSGRLIAAEMALRDEGAPGKYQMILGARDADRLETLAEELGMEHRVFGLDDRSEVRRGLRDIDVVINAAGPFAWTAERLAKVALEVECHYVDINGEADVYKRLDDLNVHATQRDVAIVCGAGFWAAASDLLLETALRKIADEKTVSDGELGSIRIGMSRIMTFSRGSAQTVWRSLREQVIVVRKGEVEKPGGGTKEVLVLWHEPIGKLQRTFDFGEREKGKRDLRIASAASLVDTLAARLTVVRNGFMASSIESYVETGLARRIGYQMGSLMAPVAAMPAVRAFLKQPLSLLADGPTPKEREDERHIVLLEIEDPFRTPIISWRWETPNVYQFNAQLVVEVAIRLARSELKGWRTPSEVLGPMKLDLSGPMNLDLSGDGGFLRGSRLAERST